MSLTFRPLLVATLLALAAPAWAHPGHDHDGLAHALLHLLFDLHGWPTPLAWVSAVAAAAVAALAGLGLRRLWTRRKQQRAAQCDRASRAA